MILENDLKLVAALRQLLHNAGYQVTTVTTLDQAYAELAKRGYDLVIIDRILDDGDGLEVGSFLREVSYGTKLLFLTQKSRLEDKIQGLTEGADDYLAKPFHTQELVLRLKNLLHRQKIKDQEYLQVGSLSLQPTSGRLKVADHEITLRKREAEILACLVRMQGSVVSKDTLIEYVWQSRDEIPTHTTLEVYIRRLRMALGKQQNMIKTVRGFGYTITAH